MLKILFISVIDTKSEIEKRYPDLGLAYLAAQIKKYFPQQVQIKIINRNVAAALADYQPDLIGLRSVSQNYGRAKKIAEQAHALGIPVMIGGVHISVLPQSLDRHMSVACLDEGEETIIDLLNLFLAKRKFVAADLAEIAGLAFWEGEQLIVTPQRQLIADLDTLPLPARELLDIQPHTYMFTSRGCPYRCRFCSSSSFWNRLRFFSADYVVNEIGVLAEEYKVNFISFYDDMFISNLTRLRQIATGLERAGLLKKVKFSCSCAAPNITEEVAYILKEMNIVSVGMGLESGSNKILEYLKGPAFKVEKNRRAVEILRQHGIAANASFVIGSPPETAQDILETYDFIKKTPINLVDIYVLTPYPGTKIWDYARERKLVSDNMDWELLNVNYEVNHKKAIILSETLNREQLYQFYRKFRRLRFWRNLRNIWSHPFLIDLPKVAINLLKERLLRLLNDRS
jgi:anaerobic magnesium-protoporphyrin IX monomethyl ester cyclase